MNLRQRNLRGGWILLSAVSLSGCGALALDRAALEARDEARQRTNQAIALSRARQNEPATAERDRASAALDRAIELAHDPELVAELLAMRYQFDAGTGNAADAERTLERLSKVAPDATTTAMLIADAKAGRGDLPGASAAIEHALRFAPQTPELQWLGGILALERDQAERAREHFTRLTELDAVEASDWRVSGAIGLALATLPAAGTASDPAAGSVAANTFATAFSSDGSLPIAMMVIDELGSRSRSFEKRLRSLAAAGVEVAPDDPSLAFAKAYIDRASGFPEQALDEIDRMLARGAGPREVDLLWLACQAHQDLSQPDSALVRARILLDRMPHHLPALSLFVEATLRTGSSNPDRERATRYVGEARAHYELERQRLVESAPRETRQIRAMLQESDRQLSLLDEMDSALQRR